MRISLVVGTKVELQPNIILEIRRIDPDGIACYLNNKKYHILADQFAEGVGLIITADQRQYFIQTGGIGQGEWLIRSAVVERDALYPITENEVYYDERFALILAAVGSGTREWHVADPFAGFTIDRCLTQAKDQERDLVTLVEHANGKNYLLQERGSEMWIGEVMFKPEEASGFCPRCLE